MSGFQPCLIIQQKVYLQQLTDHANALFNLKQYLSLVLKVHGGIAEDFAVCKRNFSSRQGLLKEIPDFLWFTIFEAKAPRVWSKVFDLVAGVKPSRSPLSMAYVKWG